MEIIEIGEDAAGSGVVLQVVEDSVHLVHRLLALVELVLNAQLIAVCLADGAFFVSPLVPNMAAQLGNQVGLLLPDPQQLVQGGLPVGAAQGHQRELLFQIVAIDHAELLNGMGGSAIGPLRAHFQILIGKTVIENIQTCLAISLLKIFVYYITGLCQFQRKFAIMRRPMTVSVIGP